MTIETKHTPGPWKVRKMAIHTAIEGANGRRITDVGHIKGPECDSEADARLIAAAPELLEALQYARRIVADKLGDDSAHLAPIDAAIRKATGEAK